MLQQRLQFIIIMINRLYFINCTNELNSIIDRTHTKKAINDAIIDLDLNLIIKRKMR